MNWDMYKSLKHANLEPVKFALKINDHEELC